MSGTQVATKEDLILLEDDDPAVLIDLELDGAAVDDWDDAEVRFEATSRYGALNWSTDDPTKIEKSVGPAPTTITLFFTAEVLAVPFTGKYRVVVVSGGMRLTYRYGAFVNRQTLGGGSMSEWTFQQTIDGGEEA